ncbi:transcriptional regulator [Candidatus Woesearchaeota archaeon]|nr:transcriptional regulator [Candidatus Woesearchaeota archaeon]
MHQLKMPQEIEVWYILPALRRELAKTLVHDKKLSQREVSKLLGLTESAVSQYLKSKRAKEVAFDEPTKKEIQHSAAAIVAAKNKTAAVVEEMQRLGSLASVKNLLCTLHKSMNPELHDCDVCLKPALMNIH